MVMVESCKSTNKGIYLMVITFVIELAYSGIQQQYIRYAWERQKLIKKKQVNVVSKASIIRLRDVGSNNRRRDSQFFIGT